MMGNAMQNDSHFRFWIAVMWKLHIQVDDEKLFVFSSVIGGNSYAL